MSSNQDYQNTNQASNKRYKTAQKAMGGTTGQDRVDKTTEAYIGRVENKYNRLEHGQPVDAGHDEQIANLGNSFRKTTKLPKYQQQPPTGASAAVAPPAAAGLSQAGGGQTFTGVMGGTLVGVGLAAVATPKAK